MNKHTKTGKALTELIIETFRLNGAILKAGDKLISDLGLTSARWQVLSCLTNEPITVAEIARRMGLSRQNVQRIANRLLQDQFVETIPNPAHKRASLFKLTSLGTESMQEVTRRQREWANQVSKNMGFEEIEKTVSTMTDCRKKIDNSE